MQRASLQQGPDIGTEEQVYFPCFLGMPGNDPAQLTGAAELHAAAILCAVSYQTPQCPGHAEARADGLTRKYLESLARCPLPVHLQMPQAHTYATCLLHKLKPGKLAYFTALMIEKKITVSALMDITLGHYCFCFKMEKIHFCFYWIIIKNSINSNVKCSPPSVSTGNWLQDLLTHIPRIPKSADA